MYCSGVSQCSKKLTNFLYFTCKLYMQDKSYVHVTSLSTNFVTENYTALTLVRSLVTDVTPLFESRFLRKK